MGGLLEAENMLSLYQNIFILLELLTLCAGLAFWVITVIGILQSQWRIAEIPPIVAFFYGTYAMGWATILLAVNTDLGLANKPLMRLFTEEAIQGSDGLYIAFWYALSFASFLLLCVSAHAAMFSSASFWRKAMTTLLAVVGIQLLTYFYFDIIK